MKQQQRKQNGHDEEANGMTRVNDELDIQTEILSSSEGNPLLSATNLGLGKYDEDQLWQQIRGYRKGLYAWIAFGRVLSERQVYETKIKLGQEGYNAQYNDLTGDVDQFEPVDREDIDSVDYDTDAEKSYWTAVRERGEEIWTRLGSPNEVLTTEQLSAVVEKTGISEDFQPIFWQLVSGRHEVSRSLDAELLRDALTGVQELREQADEEEGLL